MSVNITAEQLRTVASAYGLNIHDPQVVRQLIAEFDYLTRKAAAAGDRDLQRGNVAGLLDQAAQMTAERLGVRRPMPRIERDTRDPRQRYLDSLSPEQRRNAEGWINGGRDSDAEQQRQQAYLRAEFIDKINQQAVIHTRGNMLDDHKARRLQAEYRQKGLRDTSINREDIGQTDQALLQDLSKRHTVKTGVYRPMFRFAGDGNIEAADRPSDHREQGYRPSWINTSGSGK